MKHLIFLISLAFIVFSENGFSQKNNDELNFYKATDAVDQHFYRKAIDLFQQVLKNNPDNNKVKFQLGKCYFLLNDVDSSIYFFVQASKNMGAESKEDNFASTKAPVVTLLYLGKSYHRDNQFEKSIAVLDQFSNDYPDEAKKSQKEINRIKFYCQNGINLVKNPVNMKVTNLGRAINTIYNDHSPVISADESVLIFTSRRPGSVGGKLLPDGQYDEDLYIIQKGPNNKWGRVKNMGAPINTVGHDASVALSADGQKLFLYRDDDGDGNLYVSFKEGDTWTIPRKLGNNINSKYKETQATISADGQTLFFTSNRKGGYGGMDIYQSHLLPDGSWGVAENLGSDINSPYDEESPFIHPDGVTLFFSSKGHKTMGGYDIFFSTFNKETKTWSAPENIGYPISSAENDVYYIPTPDGKRAYLTSQRFGSIGRADLYVISLPDEQEKPLTIMSGTIHTADGDVPQNMVINVTDKATGKLAGQYRPNSKTGKFLFILVPGEYHAAFMADDFLYFDNDFSIKEGSAYQLVNKPIILKPIVLNNLKYLSFSTGDNKVSEELESDLEKLAEYLREKKSYIVNIYPQNNESKSLNDSRVGNVRLFMDKHGITKDRIKFLDRNDWDVNLVIISEGNNQLVIQDENQDNSNNSSGNTQTNDNNAQVIVDQGDVIVHCLLFGFNQFQTEYNDGELTKLANYLKSNAVAKISIHGYTDLQGDADYNKILSVRRAKFVKGILVTKGVNSSQISIVGHGEDNPIAIDLSPETRKYNRRVEFTLRKKGQANLTIISVEVPEEYKIK